MELLKNRCRHMTRRLRVLSEGFENLSGSDGVRVWSPRVIVRHSRDEGVTDITMAQKELLSAVRERLIRCHAYLISASRASFASGNTLMLIRSPPH